MYLSSVRAPVACDSLPARLVPFSLLREGDVDLDEFGWPQAKRGRLPYYLSRGVGNHVLSRYPLATALLVLPAAVPVEWWLERNQIELDDVSFRLAAIAAERVTAALIAAATVVLLYLALGRLTAPTIAAAVALVYGLGTSTWSTSSQQLWQHGPAELALAGLSFCLLGPDTRRGAVGASLFAALGTLVRPSMAVFAFLAAFFVWRERRRLAAFLALPVLGAAALLTYNLNAFGATLGGYAVVRLGVPNFAALVGLLVSPNRGLLVFTPVALLALPGLVRWHWHRSRWIHYLAVGVGAYVVMYASFRGWWGGHTYGPRFLVDVLPALALCAVPTVERLGRHAAGRAAMIVLAVASVAVQAVGAHTDWDDWNTWPEPVNQRPDRVWDWSDLQIMRALRGGWRGADLAPLLWQALTDRRVAPIRRLSSDEFAGEIEVHASTPLRFRAGERGLLDIGVTNRSPVVWPVISWPVFSDCSHFDCYVSYAWRSLDGPAPLRATGGVALPRALGPGESVRINAYIEVPERPGSFELDLQLMQRFGAEGAKAPPLNVLVE